MTDFYILDTREVWWQAAIAAGERFGYTGHRIFRGHEAQGPGLGFIRPDAEPRELIRNHLDFATMSSKLKMIQDRQQVMLYDNKIAQHREWGDWMPETAFFTHPVEALAYARATDYPFVSKASVGASSVNVRILRNRREAETHVKLAFGRGLPVRHCSKGASSRQQGYVLFQRFIPHKVTWRVNAIGNGRAVFKRFCYRHKPVAQTGNVEPVMAMDAKVESLLDFADSFFTHADTRWCALDVLQEGDSWRILETSLAWPWKPTEYASTPIFRTDFKWGDMFGAMFDQVNAGAFG